MTVRHHSLLLILFTVALATLASAHEPVLRARTPINFPDLPGYLTLKCDFHIHTVFSDGYVWPNVRSEEAWREGVDAIAITDHIEYQPHKAEVTTNHNRSYEIARGSGTELDLIVIRGSEITRGMPPGHLNAIFLEDSEAVAVPEWRDSIRAAHAQGAFIFWNHPNFPGGKGEVWYSEHTELLDGGFLQGIEVVNGRSYYPKAHAWAIEKKLTMLSNSDIHMPINLDYRVHDGDHRPVTLVFATERTAEAIHEALLDRRTVVYSNGQLIGEERFLKPLFEGSVSILNPQIALQNSRKHYVQLHNDSDTDYSLERIEPTPGLETPASVTLPAHKTVLLQVTPRKDNSMEPGPLGLSYRVTNLLVGPEESLEVSLALEGIMPSPR